jgi:CRP-like cAMP-binding protein
VIQRYASGFTAALMQLVACNALHSVEQRCARWLLMARDRVGRSQFPLTQERLATMLGVRRPTVTLAVGALQRRRLIRCGPGRVLVLDRSGLQAASCECYAAINQLLRSRR